MTQNETIKQAALRLYGYDDDGQYEQKQAYIRGAKDQQSKQQTCSDELVKILVKLMYFENIPETWKLEINAFLNQQQTK